MPGLLSLCATPIGNAADAPPRLRETLMSADIVAAEDTRRAVRLFRELAITVPGRLISYYDAVEQERQPQLLTALVDGGHVALITDAGMPSVSDPGYRLVAVAVAHQVRVTVVPGPSAVTAALAVSGLPVDRFCFEGFLPRTRGARRAALQALRHEPRTMVFFEAPHRLRACLSDMSDVWGAGHSAVVCRELTKTHEEVVRGSLGELCEWSASGVRGEVTVVVRGALAPTSDSSDEWVARVDALVAGGLSTRDAVTQAAEELAVSRRSVYQAVMAARGTPHQPT